MATIPLPALHTAPIQAPQSPLETYAQLLGIQKQQQAAQQSAQLAPLQVQEAQQQVQAGALDVQQKQQQLQDQQVLRSLSPQFVQKDSSGKVTGYDYDGLIGKAQASGVGPASLTQLSTLRKTNAETALAQANGQKALLENQATLNTEAYNHLDGLKGVTDPAQRQEMWNSALQWVQQNSQSLKIDPSQLPQQAPDDKGLQGFESMLGMHAQQISDASKLADIFHKTQQGNEIQGKMNPNSPIYAPSQAAIALGTAPGAQQIQQNEVKQAAAKAGAEENARMPGEMALARQRQALSQGDPNAAGQLLVNHDATLSELKARGATPDFIEKALQSAHQLSGGKYNAQQADAEFQVAKSPTNLGFFGSAKSLTDKGGTLDQLAAAAKDLPGGKLPAFNKIADWEKAQTGSGPIAKYASLALGVADDYSKVMGGGQGSDNSRQSALNLVGASQSPEQRAASIEGIRGAVNSQKSSRIGSNPVLQRMYGDAPQATQPSAGLTVKAPNGKTYTFKDQASADQFKKNAGIE